MPIETREVTRIADLANLALDAEEVERLRHHLQSILDHVLMLDGIDPTEVPISAHPFEEGQLLRSDVPHESLGQERGLVNAPDAAAGFFRVPKVLRG